MTCPLRSLRKTLRSLRGKVHAEYTKIKRKEHKGIRNTIS